MRNPRSTTFNLTSIQSQRAAKSARRNFNARNERTKALGALPDQENRLKNQVREYTIKNQKLSDFIHHLENSATDLNQRDNLINDLQLILIDHTSSLQRRMKRIDDLEKQVLIFRAASNDEEELDKLYPIRLPDESYRTHSARNIKRRQFLPPPKYQKPKRKIFPPPKIEKTPNKLINANTLNFETLPEYDTNQTNLSKERENLVQKTLNLDRLITIQKLKLKLWHDHRKLSDLKNDLDTIQSENYNTIGFKQNESKNDTDEKEEIQEEEEEFTGQDDDDSELITFKNSIATIEERIQLEKERISYFQDKYWPIHDAAVDIQRVWRGFWQRYSNKGNTNDINNNKETENMNQEGNPTEEQNANNEDKSNTENNTNNENEANKEENIDNNINNEGGENNDNNTEINVNNENNEQNEANTDIISNDENNENNDANNENNEEEEKKENDANNEGNEAKEDVQNNTNNEVCENDANNPENANNEENVNQEAVN